MPLKLQPLQYDMPDSIHGDGANYPAAGQAPHSARGGTRHASGQFNSVNYATGVNPMNYSASNVRFNQTSHTPLAGYGT